MLTMRSQTRNQIKMPKTKIVFKVCASLLRQLFGHVFFLKGTNYPFFDMYLEFSDNKYSNLLLYFAGPVSQIQGVVNFYKEKKLLFTSNT